MTDLDELRKAAEKALRHTFSPGDARPTVACNPATILEMIGEIERLRDQLLRRNEQNERLIEIMNDQRASLRLAILGREGEDK